MAKAGKATHSFAHIGVEVQLAGEPVDATEVVLRYPLNGIPSASIKLAVGSDGSGQTARGAAAVMKAQNAKTELTVTANFRGMEAPDKQFENPTAKMFEGHTLGPRFDAQAHQSVGLVIMAEHFVADLDAANKLSWIAHADSSFDIWSTVVTGNHFDSSLQTMSIFTPPEIVKDASADMWNNGFKAVFEELAKQVDLVGSAQLADMGQPNTRAIELLNRINTGKGAMTASIVDGVDGAEAKAHIDEVMSDVLVSKGTGQTMWQTLLNVGSVWFMSVVPCFDRVLVVPHLEVLNKTYKKIELRDYWSSSTALVFPRSPVRGVAIFTPALQNVMAASQFDQEGLGTIAGLADITQFGGEPLGQMLCLEMADVYGTFSTESQAVEKLPVGGNNPRCVNNPGEGPPEDSSDEIASAFEGRVLDKVAHCMLARNRFRDQTITIGGRLRFDISPGSLVEIEMISDVGETISVFGCVSQVEYIFNAERPYAACNITASYLRTEQDQSSGIVPSEHPLYGNSFEGTTMTE